MARFSAYYNLENNLRQQICSRQLIEGRPIRSESVLARQYGICRNSVRKAIDHLVAEGLLKRVRGSGTFVVPLSSRKRNSRQEVRPVGKTILYLSFSSLYPRNSFISLPRFNDVFSCWETVLAPHGFLFQAAHVGLDWIPPECLRTGEIAGVIFDGNVSRDFYERYLSSLCCVGVNGLDRLFRCSWVLEDSFSEKDLQVEYLHRCGYRKIALLSDECELQPAKDALAGYKAALDKYGLEYRPEYVIFWTRDKINGELKNENTAVPPDYAPQLRKVFLSPDRPDAVICPDEWRAVNTLRGLANLGLSVPDDVGIISRVHPERSMNRFNLPFAFAGFHCRKREVFLEAAQVLLDEITGKAMVREKIVYLKPQFVPGESLLDKNIHNTRKGKSL